MSRDPAPPSATYTRGLVWLLTDKYYAEHPAAVRLLAHLFNKTDEQVQSDLRDING